MPGDANGNARNDFKPNCWVGDNYITGALFVAGIQVINHDFGYNDGGRDGLYGPNTKAGVKAWQSDHSRTADGIVGPNTWYDYGDVLYYSYTGSNFWAYNVAGDANRFFKANYKGTDGHFGPWSIRCGEVGFEFGTINYPNPKAPCI
ncbi:peptidoglycan-binding domain-containing protein [Actinomadura opuntiae]|uniref:peptidoglycan-binding domain-containing protein n=1 Tax=Actinomadura sp. OS1-43 TaxID=604315 RepID=UPI00255B2358|nr:peptidoglycan-binding domain-containing protein [Actinomadura sp. OS1-43]MDL4813169.1 peptidoglycan-binding domain-containing protein [Actinomadura sp. OS1-43]